MIALPWSLKLCAVLLFALAGFRLARHLFARGFDVETGLRGAPWLLALAPLLLLQTAIAWTLTLRSDLLWSLPLWLQYWATALNWGALIASLSFLAAVVLGLAFLAKDPRRWALVGLWLVPLTASEVYQQRLLRAPKLGPARMLDGVVLQSSPATCGAAATANALGLLGIERDEASMVALLGTTQGTTPAQIVYGLASLGIEARPRTITPTALDTLHVPAILHLGGASPLRTGHFVVLSAVSDRDAVILDSLTGRTHWSMKRPPASFRGRAIEIWGSQ